MVTAAAPWLTRRWRRIGSALLVGLALTHFMANPASFDTARAVLDGWLVGAAVLVALGAPSRRATSDAVTDALGAVGLPLESLEKAGVDARGSTPYFGVEVGGGKVFVKALGDDERSADILFRLYRRVLPRSFGDEKPFSTLRRAVEHEALVALAARDLGVRTPRLRAVAAVEPNGFVLAYDAIAGGSLDRFDDDDITDEVLASCWGLLAHLRRHRIAHRDLRLANIFLDDDREVWLIDFGFSEMAAPDLLLATDVAELVASSSIPVGAERAVVPRRGDRRPGAAASGGRPPPALGPQRGHPHGHEGAARSARRREGAARRRRRLISPGRARGAAASGCRCR